MLLDEGQRKAPAQARSRERRDRILVVAERLITGTGSDALRMSDVAAMAEISIGSLYQYYRDKGAILAALAERYHHESSSCLEQELADARTPQQLKTAFGNLMDTYFAMFRANQAMRDVWSAIQADPALRAIELTASRRNGAILAAAIMRSTTRTASDDLAASTLTIMALGEAAIRLALTVPNAEAEAVMESFKIMAVHALRRLTM